MLFNAFTLCEMSYHNLHKVAEILRNQILLHALHKKSLESQFFWNRRNGSKYALVRTQTTMKSVKRIELFCQTDMMPQPRKKGDALAKLKVKYLKYNLIASFLQFTLIHLE